MAAPDTGESWLSGWPPPVLAWALAFVIVMLAVEWLVLAPLAARAARWRQA